VNQRLNTNPKPDLNLRAIGFNRGLSRKEQKPMENQNPNLPEEAELSTTETLRSRISLRAYELYEARGCVDGFDVQDWLQAEREIVGDVDQPQKTAAAGR
jgi:hypothetical protein